MKAISYKQALESGSEAYALAKLSGRGQGENWDFDSVFNTVHMSQLLDSLDALVRLNVARITKRGRYLVMHPKYGQIEWRTYTHFDGGNHRYYSFVLVMSGKTVLYVDKNRFLSYSRLQDEYAVSHMIKEESLIAAT